MKIVVTGGAGFIGSNLVDTFFEGDWPYTDEVVVIDNLSTGKEENLNKNAQFVKADIRNLAEIEPYFKGADEVYHFAALPRVDPSIKDPIEFNEVNAVGTLNVFWAAKLHGVKRIVFSSSSSVYGNPSALPTPEHSKISPMSPYALQKSIGEQYAKMFCDLYGMNIVCLRYFNVYGFREPTEGMYVPVVGIWLRQWRAGEKLTVTGDGMQTRDFINVKDVVMANKMAARYLYTTPGFFVFNVGSGKSYDMNTIARWVTSGDDSRISRIPPRIEPRGTLADTEKLQAICRGDGVVIPSVDLKTYIEEERKK